MFYTGQSSDVLLGVKHSKQKSYNAKNKVEESIQK